MKWALPTTVELDGATYRINTDYRDILQIFEVFNCADMSDIGKQLAALQIFYADQIPSDIVQAASAMNKFINLDEDEDPDEPEPGPAPLYDWTQDYLAIVADVNRVIGQDIRAIPYVHWYTFMSYFHSIGEGQLSFLVGIRSKLRHGKALDEGEREFYAQNRKRVELKANLTYEESECLRAFEELESQHKKEKSNEA